MAFRNDHRRGVQDRETRSSAILPIAIGAVFAILLGWWLFTSMPGDTGATRTSAPATNNTTDTNKTNSPGTVK